MGIMSRRLKICYLREDDLLDCLAGKQRIVNLPDGAVFERVNYDFERQSFCILISHASFEMIYPGLIPPSFAAELRVDA